MKKKELVAMLLAGGQGSRLGALTRYIAKPAVSFGGKYRIIDFSLSNCVNSGIDTVGVLTQYKPMILNSYIGTGTAWDLNDDGALHLLPPYVGEEGGRWYKGTANAIFQNMDFINGYDPEYVLILSGDHIYRMDYSEMLDYHIKHRADVTIAVLEVAWEEASRFGIISTNKEGRIRSFAEKPAKPESNLASMGIYIFSTNLLREALIEDEKDKNSENDFGKNVIPNLLKQGSRLFAYPFKGYWKDVGTIESYYTANMELLQPNSLFAHAEKDFRIMTNSNIFPPHYIGKQASVQDSIICNGCMVLGSVQHSILSSEVVIEEGATVIDSVILPGAHIGKGAWVSRSIIGERAEVGASSTLGVKTPSPEQEGIVVVAEQRVVAADSVIEEGMNILCNVAV
jgi:glucose-1-phosphate adenylyltransferase